MTKEMLFLADIYTNWCKSQGLPDFMSADDLRYGRDTTDKLNFYQMNWLECFIDVWDCINQNTQEIIQHDYSIFYRSYRSNSNFNHHNEVIEQFTLYQ